MTNAVVYKLESSRYPWDDRIKFVAFMVPIIVTLSVIAGWLLNVNEVTKSDVQFAGMDSTTAIGILAISVHMIIAETLKKSRIAHAVSLILVISVVVLALIKFNQLAFGWQSIIDTLTTPGEDTSKLSKPTYMAPNTALSFILTGIASYLITKSRPEYILSAQTLSLSVILISLFAFIGHTYEVQWFYGIGPAIVMSVYTAASFMLLAVGVLFTAPSYGIMRIVTDYGPAGRVTRTLLPAAVIIPIAMGWVRLQGEHAGLYKSEVGIALMAIADIVIFTSLILWNAYFLFHTDQERRKVEEALAHNASHDYLTGVANRALFMDRLNSRMALAKRRSGPTFAVLYSDLDNFKQVNDRLSHREGDELLRLTAQNLLKCVRTSDLVARLGGDEFVILLEEVTSPKDVKIIADRILKLMPKFLVGGIQRIQVGISIGIVIFEPRHTTADHLLSDADAALYDAKHSGKGRFAIFHSPS